MVSGVRQEDSYIAIRYLHETEKYPVKKLCAILGINRSSYYKWSKREPSTKQIENEQIISWIKELYEEQNGILGYRQMTITINRVHNVTYNKKRIVAYKIGDSNNNQLVFDNFDEAVALNPDAHPLFHSDRGFQYTSKTFYNKLQAAKMRQSMSRVGRCIDNGPMERFWGMLKSEMYYLHRFTDREALILAIENYIHFYNTGRFQKRLRCMTPMEFHYADAA